MPSQCYVPQPICEPSFPLRDSSQLTVAEWQNEMAHVRRSVVVEQAWMAESGLVPYDTLGDLRRGIINGELQRVVDDPRTPYRNYLRNRLNVGELSEAQASVPYLRAPALAVLGEVATTFAGEMQADHGRFLQAHDVEAVQLSVASMVRSRRYQKRLTQGSSIALPDGKTPSTHCFGQAFDLTNFGYYVTLANGVQQSAGWHGNREQFVPTAMHTLQGILERGRRLGSLSYINENPRGKGAFHVAVNPWVERGRAVA